MDAHHIHHWCDGGETSLDNLITLCRHHHRLLHQAGYEIVKVNGDFIFKQPDGYVMPRALAQQFADGSYTEEMLAIEREHEATGLEIDAGTAVTLWDGGACDYGTVVEALMSGQPCIRSSILYL